MNFRHFTVSLLSNILPILSIGIESTDEAFYPAFSLTLFFKIGGKLYNYYLLPIDHANKVKLTIQIGKLKQGKLT